MRTELRPATSKSSSSPEWRVSCAVVAVCLYAPFSWLLFAENNWSDYLLMWLKLWPILPGFIPGAYFFHPHDLPEFVTMSLVTLSLLVGLTWLGTGSRPRLAAAAIIALAVSIPSAFFAYAAFVA
ncbi:MAG TPA: hypothetical protein VGE52_21520 [Pirellulales bacterium]